MPRTFAACTLFALDQMVQLHTGVFGKVLAKYEGAAPVLGKIFVCDDGMVVLFHAKPQDWL